MITTFLLAIKATQTEAELKIIFDALLECLDNEIIDNETFTELLQMIQQKTHDIVVKIIERIENRGEL